MSLGLKYETAVLNDFLYTLTFGDDSHVTGRKVGGGSGSRSDLAWWKVDRLQSRTTPLKGVSPQERAPRQTVQD